VLELGDRAQDLEEHPTDRDLPVHHRQCDREVREAL
jgi:hypothetical protein